MEATVVTLMQALALLSQLEDGEAPRRMALPGAFRQAVFGTNVW